MTQHLLLAADNSGHYDVTSEGPHVVLEYSKYDRSWTHPGEIILVVTDTGNGFEFGNAGKVVHISYMDANHLRLVLNELPAINGPNDAYTKVKVSE